MCIGPHVKYRYNCLTLIKLEFSQQILKKFSNIKFNKKNLPTGSRVLCERTDRQTDRHSKANSRFSQSANVPKNAPPLHRAIQDCSLLAFDLDVSDKHPLQPTHIIEVYLQQLASAPFNPDFPKNLEASEKLVSRAQVKKLKLQHVRRCSIYEAANVIITASQPEMFWRLYQPQNSVI